MPWTARAVFWTGVTWLTRAAAVGLCAVAWFLFQRGKWWWLGGDLLAAYLLYAFQEATRRQALGWIIDDHGERQKVEQWVRGRAVFTPTTRDRRLVEEAFTNRVRRHSLIWLGMPGWGAVALGLSLYQSFWTNDWAFGGVWLCGAAAVGYLFGWFGHLFDELLYLSGWQDMKGAQVLDREPSRPGLAEVTKQKAHGDGRVASEEEALALLNPKRSAAPQKQPSDIYLGFHDGASGRGAALPYGGERHLLLFGPNGSGKGTGVLVPNLLRLQDRSIVVIDPKGELAAITKAQRETYGQVVVLNPFGILGIQSSGFNPLAALDPDAPTFLDDATGIGEALIRIEDKDPHWSESAQGLLVALLMWEVKEARRQGRVPLLANVRAMLTEADEWEVGPDGKKRIVKGLSVTARYMVAKGGEEIASLIARFTRDTDEVASIRSTADRQTWWMLSQPMRENLACNDIDFADLKRRPITVYIVLPAERMRTHSVWLRLVIVSALRALYKPGGVRTLFMLDEFAQLGRLGPIEDAFGLVRGYGVQLWPVLQDLTQLQELYEKRWESFVANAGIVQGFAPNDLTTADWMSRRASDDTAVVTGYNTGDSRSSSGNGRSQGTSYQQTKRPVFLPQELMQLKPGTGLIFTAGTAISIPFDAPPYWDVPVFNNLASPNPYYQT